MTTINSPKPSMDPQSTSPDPGPGIGDRPNFRVMTASKKVDDLSRHESKHDMAPKHDPKFNAREKAPDTKHPGAGQPQGGKPAPGTFKK